VILIFRRSDPPYLQLGIPSAGKNNRKRGWRPKKEVANEKCTQATTPETISGRGITSRKGNEGGQKRKIKGPTGL